MAPVFSAPLALLAVVLVACTPGAAGNGVATLKSADPGASAAPSRSMSPQEAALAFARCMREHGVDMPDPRIDETNGRVAFGLIVGGSAADKRKVQAAQEACKHFLQAAPFGKGEGGQIDRETQEKILAYTRCMREHGIDMPDPQFSDGGMVKVGGDGEGPAFDPNSKEFQDAQRACQSLAPVGPDGGVRVEAGRDGSAPGTPDDGKPAPGTQP